MRALLVFTLLALSGLACASPGSSRKPHSLGDDSPGRSTLPTPFTSPTPGDLRRRSSPAVETTPTWMAEKRVRSDLDNFAPEQDAGPTLTTRQAGPVLQIKAWTEGDPIFTTWSSGVSLQPGALYSLDVVCDRYRRLIGFKHASVGQPTPASYIVVDISVGTLNFYATQAGPVNFEFWWQVFDPATAKMVPENNAEGQDEPPTASIVPAWLPPSQIRPPISFGQIVLKLVMSPW